MAFVDELNIHIKAGAGGHGVERWKHEKGKEMMGPSGGNGGHGGNVFVEGIRDIGALGALKRIKELEAGRGVDGGKNSMYGKAGNDLTVKLPVGSLITNLTTGATIDLMTEGEPVQILRGGGGGFGNEHFKSSTNVVPKQTTNGKPGEESDFHIELRLIVDAGFVGFPNAGKSSLLNALTNAKSKVASYQFTTLEPSLGDMYTFILADIPGLIEGASEGKGLGTKFLKHIARTKTILHCISLENEDIASAYKTIRAELEAFGEGLAEKKEILILTKTDLVDEKTLKAKIKEAKKLNKEVYSVSVIDDEQVKALSDSLVKTLRAL
jgi:GTP-binding protein